jgi:peptidyl-prolyl cis-trans isomerase C
MTFLRGNKIIITAAVVAGIVFSPIFALGADPQAMEKAADINGKQISYKDFERQLEMFKQQALRGQPGQLPDAMEQRLKQQVIQKMISDELLLQKAGTLGIQIEAKTVDDEINKIKGRFKDQAQFLARIKSAGLDEKQLREQIHQQAVISKLIEKEIVPNVTISDDELKKYYDANMDKFRRQARVRARHILMKTDKDASEDQKAEARKKLQEIQKKILAGEDFSALAKAHSEGPSNVKGGDLGYFTKGRMVKPFEEVAFKLAPNEVSDIVETQFGYHLIKVVDRQEASNPPFETVRDNIKSILFKEQVQKKMGPYVEALRKKADIQIYVK